MNEELTLGFALCKPTRRLDYDRDKIVDPALLFLRRRFDGRLRLGQQLGGCRRSPFSGLGKPEPLRGEFAGYWSRRIDNKHRLVNAVAEYAVRQSLVIVQCRYHY